MSDAEVSSPEVSADKLDAAPTDEWRSYDEFAAGIDTYRLPNADLTGQTIAVELTGGPTVHLEFLDSGTVSCWNVRRRPQRARLAAFMARRSLIGRRVMWVYSEPGKSADFVVLDRDPLRTPVDEVHDIRATETWFAGRRVFAVA